MKRSMIIVASVVVGLLAAGAASGATVYTSESSFTAALTPGYYLEDFTLYANWGPAASPISQGPVNGWQYNVSASFGNLWGGGSNPCISTEWPDAVVTVTITGSQQVYAIGGQFFGSDWDQNPMTGTVKVDLSDGTSESFTTGLREFRGFTSAVPITSLSVSVPGAPHDLQNRGPYPTVDHLYVGIPEPATMTLLVLGGVATLIRRKRHA